MVFSVKIAPSLALGYFIDKQVSQNYYLVVNCQIVPSVEDFQSFAVTFQ